MTLFIALNEIRENQDPTLQFDFVCRAGICGACGMLIDGRPGLACRTLTRDLGSRVTLAPLPVFRLIGDLSVDTGAWMQGMAERLETWVHLREQEPDLGALEERMEPALAEEIYELERCIECGCCVAACATARMREDFVGAAGLNKIARFRLDPRDTRSDEQFYELIGDMLRPRVALGRTRPSAQEQHRLAQMIPTWSGNSCPNSCTRTTAATWRSASAPHMNLRIEGDIEADFWFAGPMVRSGFAFLTLA